MICTPNPDDNTDDDSHDRRIKQESLPSGDYFRCILPCPLILAIGTAKIEESKVEERQLSYLESLARSSLRFFVHCNDFQPG